MQFTKRCKDFCLKGDGMENLPQKRILLAPAKINLCLHVLARRSDGYHDLSSIMQRVSLFDRVELSLSAVPGVRVSCPSVELGSGEENVAARAARALLGRATEEFGIEIAIDKQIPVAAGLGGGSSDAASVLVGLNEMLGLGLDRRTLMSEGAKLGADVPFFVFEQTAWATGIGEVLTPFPVELPLWYVLVNPGIAVSTAWVYQNLALTSHRDAAKMPRFPRTPEELVALLHNDLEQVTIAGHPLVGEIKDFLLSLGAIGSLMSGSGSTVFGVFSSERAALRAAEVCSGEPGWWSLAVHPV
jgi:4-diphosphocytidyl-2-C-methyl-D-erythritol kinase